MMVRNTYRKSKLTLQHEKTVTELFAKHDIDLTLVGAGRTLYQSLRQAKERTKGRTYYKNKGVKYNFPKSYKHALIEVIQGDDDFWQAWIKQHEIYEEAGFDEDLRPSIHRINPNGHYELGNIAVLPYGEHLQENAKTVIVFDTDTGKFTNHRSQKAFQEAENVSPYQVQKMNKAFKTEKALRQ